MPIPEFQTIMLPLLQALRHGNEVSMRELSATLADHFQLTEEEKQQMLPSGGQPVFENRAGWAKSYLKKAGLLENPTRGRVRISEKGLFVLQQNPASINTKFLMQFPDFLAFRTESSQRKRARLSETSVELTLESSQTPRELLDAAYAELRKQTADELLGRLKACSPGFFEQVVVQLLEAMGYGGLTGNGTVTGKGGDGGIDGIIKEDKLGLDVVCLQAKRWEGTVGRPIVQGFVGSMDYIRARKGVIVTTSQFSHEATEFVDRIEGKKVVLIDGLSLVDLMMDHQVGVISTKRYELMEVSNDFFDEDDF